MVASANHHNASASWLANNLRRNVSDDTIHLSTLLVNMKKKLKHLMINICLSLVTLGVCIFLIEICFRVGYTHFSVEVTKDRTAKSNAREGNKDNFVIPSYPNGLEALKKFMDGTNYPLNPNVSVIYTGESILLPATIISTNSQGLRDYEYTIRKARNTTRIICLGDSVTFGQGVNLSDSFSKVLERKLNLNSTRRYEVLNFGVFGYGTLNELELLERKALNYSPDIVVLMMLDNDYQNIGDIQKDNPVLETLRKGLLQNSSLHIAQYLEKELVVLEYMKNEKNYNDTEKFNLIIAPLDGIISISHQHNISLVVVQYFNNMTYMYSIRTYLKDKGISVVALYESPIWQYYQYKETSFPSPDGHPTPLGHKVIAEIIYEELRNKHLVTVS
jgi:lysophospholipase L1-like esterase